MGENDTYRLIPDWEKPRALILVWPVQVYRKYLLQFYSRFVSYLPDDVKLICLVKNIGIEREVKASINAYSKSVEIQFLAIPDVTEIWIRDWGPIPARDSTGKTVAIKAIYRPRYLSKSAALKARAFADDIAGRKLAALLGLPVMDIPLVWDIGNLTHNGEGTAIVTSRLIDDNKDTFTESRVRELLREILNITRLIILPEEPEDETGHIDGMVRFLDPKTLAVGAYPSGWSMGKRFMDRIATTLRQELGTEYTIVRIPNGVPPNEKKEGVYSAFGNHINFLRFGNTLLLPAYGIQEDSKSEIILRESLSNTDVIPAYIPDINKLASRGGVLHCMTWVLY